MTEEYTTLVDIPVTRQQIENCTFSHWYPKLKKHTPKTEVIKPVPSEFIRYLEQDGIQLPEEKNVQSFYTGDLEHNEDNDYSDWEQEQDESSDEDDSEDEQVQQPKINPLVDFPQFHQQLKDVLERFGAVTPKLNWSAPQDATWILPNNSMKCNEVNELYLLLNASNYIMHDLQYAFDDCVDNETGKTTDKPEFELILRKWFDVNPALEFRVFVKDGKVVGASQRDLNFYDYLSPLSDTFKDLIDEFVEDVVVPAFPDSSFVVDLYIPRPFDRVYLIDINPFSRKTDSLMFSWNELANFDAKSDDDYELRLVMKNNTGRFACKEHSENQVPDDVVQASLDPNSIRELATKWKELLAMQNKEDAEPATEATA